MRDIAPTLLDWIDQGTPFALATVVAAKGSSPRGPGSAMGIREDGLIAGSVSGGCVEGAVVEAALRSLRLGKPEMLEFGPESDAVLFEVGLSCGGSIGIWVEPIRNGPQMRKFVQALIEGQSVSRLTVLDPSAPGVAILGNAWEEGDEKLLQSLAGSVRKPQSDAVSRADVEGRQVLVETYAVRSRLILVGAVHIAVPLVGFARALGMEVVVIDPRASFARPERFPTAPDALLQEWPEKALERLRIEPSDALATLSHDPKIDDPALDQALRAGCWYVGALGSTKTQAKKRERLLEMGASLEDLDRIHGPIGLDICAKSPEEIALSILAEIVAARASRAQP